jgi:O-methyltransferase
VPMRATLGPPRYSPPMETNPALATGATDLYLDLMKRCLTREVMRERYRPLPATGWKGLVCQLPHQFLGKFGLELVRQVHVDAETRAEGHDWPSDAETMIGRRRLDNLHHCVTQVLADNVPGDLVETGVWRGGSVIFMRAALKAHGVRDRTVWVADSFCGLPAPDVARYPHDRGDALWKKRELAIPVEQVQSNFARYGLLDEQVQFLVGWFKDTLPTAPIDRLAVLRLDGDLYESTMDALTALYPKLTPGGFVIVDDYGAMPPCKAAVTDYRAAMGIVEEIVPIDRTGVFWRRNKGPGVHPPGELEGTARGKVSAGS